MIQQLQLPPLINVPQLDQTALGQIGDTIAAYRQRSDLANALPSILGQPAQQPASQGNSLANLGQPAPATGAQLSGNGLTQDQMALLAGAARKYGIDPNYLVQVASLEGTGKNPASTAQGLGQFIDSTAKQYGVVRGNDASAADGLARFTLDNSAALTKALGRPPTPGELYLAHQQGAAGAARLIGNPNSPASALVGSPAIVNNGGAPNETASQFTSPYLQRFANLPSAITNGSQPATSQPGGAGMQPSPAATPTQPLQQQPSAAPQSTATAPAIASSPALQGIRPDVLAKLQAMIRAGGPAQQFAMAALQKYVVPQQPIIVPEGGTAVNPLTGAVVARGQPKSYNVTPGGTLVTPGVPGQGGSGVTPTYQNTTGTLDDKTLTGLADRYLKTGDNQIITDVGNGTFGSVNKAALLQKIEQMRSAGNVSPTDVVAAKGATETQIKAQKDFGTGPQGNTVRSLNVAIDHLDTLRQYATALQNGNYPIINSIRNRWREETGSELPTNFDALTPLVTGEVAKAVIGSNNAISDREELRDAVKNSASFAQLGGAIGAYEKLMSGQMNGLQRQYETSTRQKDFDKFLSDRTKTVLRGGGEQGGPKIQKVTTSADANSAIAAAKAAIAQGADPKAVNARLQQMGVPPIAWQ